MIEWILAHPKELIELLFAVLGVFSLIAKLTPTKVDDNIIQFVLNIVHTLGLTKDGAKKPSA